MSHLQRDEQLQWKSYHKTLREHSAQPLPKLTGLLGKVRALFRRREALTAGSISLPVGTGVGIGGIDLENSDVRSVTYRRNAMPARAPFADEFISARLTQAPCGPNLPTCRLAHRI
jgi:hypothetical protein